MKTSKNVLGQYFTPQDIAEFMLNVAKIEPTMRILEPSSGEGIFMRLLRQRGCNNLTACEIDPTLATKNDLVRCESFVSAHFEHSFDCIIGNPPYIRWANLEESLKQEVRQHPLWQRYCNSLCDYLSIFILKSIDILADNGRLIFICPDYWFSTTHAQPMRDFMLFHGYVEEIIRFGETPIFAGVTMSCMIFVYRKSASRKSNINVTKIHWRQKLQQQDLQNLHAKEPMTGVEYFTIAQFRQGESWVIANIEEQQRFHRFEQQCVVQNGKTSPKTYQAHTLELFDHSGKLFIEQRDTRKYAVIGDVCDIGNGLVSGLDKAFQRNGTLLAQTEESYTLSVVKAKDLRQFYYERHTPYLFLPQGLLPEQVQADFPNILKHLEPYKTDLDARYRYNRDIPYWEWVFPRNLALFRRPEPRIFVPCKERISHKSYFRFALVPEGLYPTQDVTALLKKPSTKESIEYITAFLNNHRVFEWLKGNGIVKGGIVEFSERPLASIPFRMIDWNNSKEVLIHNDITTLCQLYIQTNNVALLEEIEQRFRTLFDE